jgi:hypothetical protein
MVWICVTYSDVNGVLIDGLNDQATLDGATGNLVADAHDASGDPTSIVVFVGVSGDPDCNNVIVFINCVL